MTDNPRAGDDVTRGERLLAENVRYVHGRDTCDDAGRPLSTYACDYHQGYEDGLDVILAELAMDKGWDPSW